MILLDLVGTRQTRFGNWFPQTAHLYSRMSLIGELSAYSSSSSSSFSSSSSGFYPGNRLLDSESCSGSRARRNVEATKNEMRTAEGSYPSDWGIVSFPAGSRRSTGRKTILGFVDTAREHGCHFGHRCSRAVLVTGAIPGVLQVANNYDFINN